MLSLPILRPTFTIWLRNGATIARIVLFEAYFSIDTVRISFSRFSCSICSSVNLGTPLSSKANNAKLGRDFQNVTFEGTGDVAERARSKDT